MSSSSSASSYKSSVDTAAKRLAEAAMLQTDIASQEVQSASLQELRDIHTSINEVSNICNTLIKKSDERKEQLEYIAAIEAKSTADLKSSVDKQRESSFN